MLHVAGNLNSRTGGPGVFVPVQEALVKQQLYKPSQWTVTLNKTEHFRRSIYLVAKRNLRLPMMEAFDAPDMQNSCPRREQSTHPLQALEMLNGEFSNAQARVLAGRLLRECNWNPQEIVRNAFRLVAGRLPSDREASLAQDFLSNQTSLLRDHNSGKEEYNLPTWMPATMESAAASALCDFSLAMFNLPAFLYLN